jgi:hydroxymethylbilane synthase
MPLAAFATLDGGLIRLKAAWGDPEGSTTLVTAQGTSPVGDLSSAAALGEQVASQLRAQGAG